MKKNILLILVIIFIAIQFIRPSKNKSGQILPGDIINRYHVPGDISIVLQKACYDCHSNNTSYPWYAGVQPVGWWLNHHITEGKEELNFSDFGSYRIAKQYHKLDETIEQIKKDEMPLWSYTFIHTNAKLTDAEKQTLIKWCETVRDTIRSRYPADSLIIKRR